MKTRPFYFSRAAFCAIVLSLGVAPGLSFSVALGQTPGAQSSELKKAPGSETEFRVTDMLARAQPQKRPFISLMSNIRAVNVSGATFGPGQVASGPNLPVQGSGTIGRITKWTGLTSGNSFIGDTTIFETKTGSVGIGTDTPTSKLTVAGMIETTLGGYKFPDGTVQTTAAVAGLTAVVHDSTLKGNGTAAMPLGIAIPLSLIGSAGELVTVQNNGNGGHAMSLTGGDATDPVDGLIGGFGLFARGGNSLSNDGGDGVFGAGGNGSGKGNTGGAGLAARGGEGLNGATEGLAADLIGSVEVIGNLDVSGTKNFKIDHPLDPENKYLYHAAIESSEVLNVYSGNVMTNERGEAIVTLPDWFEALNKDFRYQLTPIGAPAQGLYIAEKINTNRFKIAGGKPGMEVSWQVTGVRSDAAMRTHPFKAEEDKRERERGTYLNPELYGQPEEKSVQWTRNPRMMQQFKQRRIEAEQTRGQKAGGQ